MSLYMVMPIVQAVSCLVLALIVVRRNFTHNLFSMFLVCLGIWGIIVYGMRTSPDVEYAYMWDRMVIPLSPFMSVLFYHFSIRFTGIQINKFVLPVFYAICVMLIPLAMTDLIFSGMQVKSYGFAPVFGPLWTLWITIIYLLTLITLLNFIRARRSSRYAEQRNRLGYIIVGIIISMVGGLFDALPVFGLPLYPGAIFATIIFCILTTVAIIKYNLLAISLLFRRSAAYLLTSIIVSAPIIVSFFVVTQIISQSDNTPWSYLLLMVIVLIALLFPLLWRLVQRNVDRLFYRQRYDYIKALENFKWHTERLSDFEKVGDDTVKMVAGALNASSVYLLQPVLENGDFTITSSTGGGEAVPEVVIKSRSPLARWLQRSGEVLLCRDIQIIPQLQNVVWAEIEMLTELQAEYIAPLKARMTQLSGLLIVGRKEKGQSYGIEDRQLLSTVSNQIAVTLENMRMYDDIFKAREDLETWLNGMSDCVIIINSDKTIQFMNQAARSSFGPGDDRKCWETLGFEEECGNCVIADIVSDEGTNNYTESRMVFDKEYEIATAPLLNPDGTKSIIKVFRDVTERKRLEDEIIQAKVRIETLHESERLKTELLSMVSHELRTPLSVIKGYITSLLGQKGWSKQEQKEFLSDINQETDYLNRLVANLLDMSRLEAGGMQLARDWYHVSEVLEWIEDALKAIVKEHILRVSIPDDLPLVYIDRIRIGQVLINFCDNAVKYSEPGSEILIEAEATEESVVISVSDMGKGIELEDLDKVFDRFYRVADDGRSQSGIGLGLSICRGIVETHGGIIWAQSEVGKGSKFSIELPVSRMEVAGIQPV